MVDLAVSKVGTGGEATPPPSMRPLPSGLTDGFDYVGLDCDLGISLLQGCRPEHISPLAEIMRHHQISPDLVQSGIASATIIVNALELPGRPILDQYTRPEWGIKIRYATPSSLLETLPATESTQIQETGATLDQLHTILKESGAEGVRTQYVDESLSLDHFRDAAIKALLNPDTHMLVNYARERVGQNEGGNHSPVAAYNSDHDMFLVYDVVPWIAAPLWITSERLFEAMNTFDSVAQKRRGFLVARRSTTDVRLPDITPRVPEITGEEVIMLGSPEGQRLLLECDDAHLSSLPSLMRHHETPEDLSLGELAGAAMVANALGLGKIESVQRRLQFGSEQDRISQGTALATRDSAENIQAFGVSLSELRDILFDCGANVELHPTRSSEDNALLDHFRETCVRSLLEPRTLLLALFDRRQFGQTPVGTEVAGHSAPIAAYNVTRDMFLIYDPVPWQDSVWVTAERLRNATEKRGLLVASYPEKLGVRSTSGCSRCGPMPGTRPHGAWYA